MNGGAATSREGASARRKSQDQMSIGAVPDYSGRARHFLNFRILWPGWQKSQLFAVRRHKLSLLYLIEKHF